MRGSFRRGLGILALVVLLLSACGAVDIDSLQPEDEAIAAAAVDTLPEEVSPADLAALYDTEGVTIVDVREESEYAEGHIPGAILIPLGSLSQRAGEIPTDGPVVLVCRSGNRSGQAYQILRQQGFDNVSNMLGGMNAWRAAGLEIEK